MSTNDLIATICFGAFCLSALFIIYLGMKNS